MSNSSNSTEIVEDMNIRYKLYIIVPIIWSSIIFFGIIADLCFTLACAPVTMAAYVYKEWIFGSFMCRFQNLIMFSSVQAACLTLTAMTVDRYLAVLYPFKSIVYRTTKLALMTNIIIWIASLTLNIPYFLYYGLDSISNPYCISMFPSKRFEEGLTIYTVLISYVLPLLTIIFCYMRMILRIYSKSSDQKLVEESKNFSTTNSINKNCQEIGKKNVKNKKIKKRIDKHEFYTEDDMSDNETNNFEIKKDETRLSKQCTNISRNNSSDSTNQKNSIKKKYSTVSANCTYQNYMGKASLNLQKNANSALAIKKQKFKILLLIAIVSITFALTWLPAHVIQIWKVVFNDSFPYSDTMYIIKVISHTLTYSNSLLNPFIYVFIGAKFRNHLYSEFNELYQFYCLRRKKRVTKNSNSRMSSAGNYETILNRNRCDKPSCISVLPNESYVNQKNVI